MVAPDPNEQELSFGVQSSPGTYVLYFLKETPTGVAPASDSEPVNTYLVLKSEVRDANGSLAQAGTVTYEYCSANGRPAPSASCTTGSGRWKRWGSGSVDPYGTLFGYGSCSTPQTIGFRFKYAGSKGGIASGSSAARDFSWI